MAVYYALYYLKCFYVSLAWRWPTWVEMFCFNKHQNIVVLTVVIGIVIIR